MDADKRILSSAYKMHPVKFLLTK